MKILDSDTRSRQLIQASFSEKGTKIILQIHIRKNEVRGKVDGYPTKFPTRRTKGKKAKEVKLVEKATDKSQESSLVSKGKKKTGNRGNQG